MLCLPFSDMKSHVWKCCPSTSNAVERKNSECKVKHPLPLKAAMINVYNIGLYAISTYLRQKKSSISYHHKTDELRAADAQCRKKERYSTSSVSDPEAMWGPPDKNSNFNGGCMNVDKIKRPKRIHSQTGDKCEDVPPSKKCARTPILVGKNIEMEFANEDGSTTWWLGRVTSTTTPMTHMRLFPR